MLLLSAQSDIFSSLAHFTIHILSNEDEEKKVYTSNCIKYIYIPVCRVCICADGVRQMEHGLYLGERERMSISCNFESPCLITTILSHILRHVQHSQMQYAVI